MRNSRTGPLLLTGLLIAGGALGACSSGTSDDGRGSGSGGGSSGTGSVFNVPDGSVGQLTLSPPSADVTVNPADGPPSGITFTLGGAPQGTPVSWRVSNPAVGWVDSQGVFTPTGQAGGVVEVQAIVGDEVVKAVVTVTVLHRENGGDTSDAGPGFGGLGGVGGEGFGGALTPELVSTLEGTPQADPSLSFLYPYDQTVFPLGVLPPLLQWTEGSHGAIEGVQVHLSAAPHYDYKGFFGRPPRLAAGASLVRHPIPKAVWEAATRTAAGGTLNVELVVAAGGVAYGPIRQSYKVALAPINGKVYYQAYNTALAHNYGASTVSGDPMGGATLSVTLGQEGPELVAGRTTDDSSGCRVCHSVSAYGDRMLVQHGDGYQETSSIDLKNGNAETAPYAAGILGWAGIYPDGTLGLANSVVVANTGEVNGTVGLFDLASGANVPAPGLRDFVTSMGLPAFSPDGKRAVFTFFEGPSTPEVGPANGRKLVVMDFDLATKAFSNPRLLWEATEADQRPAWSTFMPTSNAVIFQRRFTEGSGETFGTRNGARGELWWVDVTTGQAAPLAATNGLGYLPDGPDNHDEDELLNYEPSISPVASGGYAWMVFMSRRMYGNVAVADPFHSDPRDYDLTLYTTTKKIWMAAIDLEAAPGTDPSHPAFYIPGQELQGVNSRPFFALDPCVSDRGTCSTGVDCCSGFCRDGYCSPPPVNDCSQIDERCESTSDCCDSRAQCIGGFCAILIR